MNTEFLQSPEWLRFQEATGKEILPMSEGDFLANGIIHTLPVVGRYVYVPRGPVFENAKLQMPNVKTGIETLVVLAKEKRAKWIRIEPETDQLLEEIQKSVLSKVVQAPHDMQPREIFKINITKTEEELLAEMKSKTRYNIRLAEKHGVKVFETREERYIAVFLDLITATSNRKGITAHSRTYYERFFQVLPQEMCRLFVAEYEGQVLAANMVMFYGNTVTYLHGGTADLHRDVMAPYLLQWEQIKAAQKEGYQYYDFGGVQRGVENGELGTRNEETKQKDWSGITKFKTGFSPKTKSILYTGSYDIVLDSLSYTLYRFLQQLKSLIHSI
ncbi:MAG: peptidoglycan bridge formation glycyltransferase FemA/FemB family protein [Candidatus Moranbacteria bacterium]|nr:peptidoglycan bridge formation glycyltransferase FemA/FemB family protein [Candidatus Moranbacteria bacterium]